MKGKLLKILGSNIGILLLAGSVIGLGALVNYLSNTITYTATLESPLYLHDLDPANGDFGTVYGGDTRTASYLTDNRANNDVDGKHEITIYAASTDLASGDITEVVFTYDGVSYTLSGTQITETTGDFNGDGLADLRYTAPVITHTANSANVATSWDITFNSALAPDNYSFEVVVRPA